MRKGSVDDSVIGLKHAAGDLDLVIQSIDTKLKEHEQRLLQRLLAELTTVAVREQMASAAEHVIGELIVGLGASQAGKPANQPSVNFASGTSSASSMRSSSDYMPGSSDLLASSLDSSVDIGESLQADRSLHPSEPLQRVSEKGVSWAASVDPTPATASQQSSVVPMKSTLSTEMMKHEKRDEDDVGIGSNLKRFGGMSSLRIKAKDDASRPSLAIQLEGKAMGHQYSLQHGAARKLIRSSTTRSEQFSGAMLKATKTVAQLRPEWVPVILAHPLFDFLIGMFIFLNTVAIGVQTHLTALNRGAAQDPIWSIFDIVFCVIFTGELGLRVINEHLFFFMGRNWRWNWFDTFVVAFALIEIVAEAEGLGMLRFLRIIRIVRLVRLMRFLPDLRNMISGILGAVRSLLWSMVLLIMVMFIFGVLLTEVVNMTFEDLPPEHASLQTYADVVTSIYHLFQAICGGVDWGTMADPLLDISWLVPFLFMGYICFSVFCVLNIIAAVFVQQSNKICSLDKENIVSDEIDERRSFLEEAENIFNQAESQDPGWLSRREFHEHFSKPRVRAIFRRWNLDIEIFGTGGLFDILDPGRTDTLDVETFKHGVDMLKGGAKSLDLFLLQHDLARLHRKVEELQANTELLVAEKQNVKEDQLGASLRHILHLATSSKSNNRQQNGMGDWTGSKSLSTSGTTGAFMPGSSSPPSTLHSKFNGGVAKQNTSALQMSPKGGQRSQATSSNAGTESEQNAMRAFNKKLRMDQIPSDRSEMDQGEKARSIL